MTNILISGKAMALKTAMAKSIARSIPGKNNIQVYTNDGAQYLGGVKK